MHKDAKIRCCEGNNGENMDENFYLEEGRKGNS